MDEITSTETSSPLERQLITVQRQGQLLTDSALSNKIKLFEISGLQIGQSQKEASITDIQSECKGEQFSKYAALAYLLTHDLTQES